MPLRLVFFGTPFFAKQILNALIEKGADIVAVVTKPDKPIGRSKALRPPPVKVLAQEKLSHIPLYQPKKASAPEFASVLQELKADLFVVAAYSEIIKENLLSMPTLDCINVHGSILPKYRGAAPVQRAIMAGEEESGVTIMSMVRELDAGDMLKIAKVPIHATMTAGELMASLAEVGGEALWEVIQAFEKGAIQRTAQNANEATFAPKINLQDAHIRWDVPAQNVHNLVRGVTPKPGAWCEVFVRGKKRRLLIKKTSVVSTCVGSPGELTASEDLVVACLEGGVAIETLQLEGKREQSAPEFLRGVPKNTLRFF